MPLGATKLYLFGISVDQQFRTEYLTRLTDTAALHDMTYFGLPPFYPAGLVLDRRPDGGVDRHTGMGDVQAVGDHVDRRRDRGRFRVVGEHDSLRIRADRVDGDGRRDAGVFARRAVRRGHHRAAARRCWCWRGPGCAAGRGRAVGPRSSASALFLGVAALFYTLLLAYGAFTVAIMAVALALARRSAEPLLRLAVIAVIAAAIALIGWLPYLLAAIGGSPADSGTAQHYLPPDGAQLSFPMLEFTLLGALCMVGTLWLVVRARSSTRAAGLAFGVLAVYAWSLLSMLTTLAGTTLLSFRLQPTLTVLLTAAGAFGFIEVTLAVARRYSPDTGRRIVVAAGAVGAIGAMTFAQDIPDVLRSDIVVAYTDTDGYGQRADRRPPGAEKYYREIDAKIQEVTGRPRNETVVLTADYSFLSYYPYYGFQGLTSHYANPLAQFDERAAAIERWATLERADQFIADLDKLPWTAPTVFLMRRGGAGDSADTYTLRLAPTSTPTSPTSAATR